MAQQVDLFLETILDTPVKDERALMEFPFFALTKQARMTPFIYDDNVARIEIQPGHKGMATIWDKDVLIYCASLINERLERNLPFSRTLQISAHNFLKVTGRSTGKRGYELFLDALDRLQSTTIKTTITSGFKDERERRGFSWLDSYRVVEKDTRSGRRVMAAVEITLNRWLYRALVEDRRVLTIDRAYFSLSKSLERRLYELARKHCGHQQMWTIGLARLAEKCGSDRDLRNFKREIKIISERDSLPQYHVRLSDERDVPNRTTKSDQENVKKVRRISNNRLNVVFSPRIEQKSAQVIHKA